LALELEETVHELVHSIDFDDQELLIEDLVILRVDESEAFCEKRCGFEQVFVFEMVDSTFSYFLKIVHEDEGCLLCLQPILLAKRIDSAFEFLYLRVVFYFG